MKSKSRRWIVMSVLMVLFLSVIMMSMRLGIQRSAPPEVSNYKVWDKELVEHVASMPMQDRERLKPFSTWASFKLYGIHSKRSIKITVDGEKVKISPTEWALDCLFRPEIADDLPLFGIDDDRITKAFGVKVEGKKKRDMYSFNELNQGEFGNLFDQESARINRLEAGKQKIKGLDSQIKNFITNVNEYRLFRANLMYLHNLPIPDSISAEELAAMKNYLPEEYHTSELTTTQYREANLFLHTRTMISVWNQMTQMSQEEQKKKLNQPEILFLAKSKQNFDQSFGLELKMRPPEDKDDTKWYGWQYKINEHANGSDLVKLHQGVKEAVRWSEMIEAYKKGDQAELLKLMQNYSAGVEKLADARGEDLEIVASEVAFYKADHFYRSLYLFLGACFVAILMLPSAKSKWGKVMYGLLWAFSLLGLGMLVKGIVLRAIIMERYPLGNLYDTILFATASAVFVMLFMEGITRRRICIALSVVLGATGLFLANGFEVGNASDHMTPLNAVLLSNFWLSTHVTTIILGYAGGLVAAILSIVYLFARWTGVDEGDQSFRRFMTRVVYGTCCFTLFFSLVGTILGGVWANDSWGRFWGWDPKENGALMIVLWYLIILHARLAGFIKEWGLHICSVFGASIVAFSWWGVNFLSTGLHSYGFSGGEGARWLTYFVALIGIIVTVAIGTAWYDNAMKKQRKLQAAQEREEKEEA